VPNAVWLPKPLGSSESLKGRTGEESAAGSDQPATHVPFAEAPYLSNQPRRAVLVAQYVEGKIGQWFIDVAAYIINHAIEKTGCDILKQSLLVLLLIMIYKQPVDYKLKSPYEAAHENAQRH
jgi:hypothetical protein